MVHCTGMRYCCSPGAVFCENVTVEMGYLSQIDISELQSVIIARSFGKQRSWVRCAACLCVLQVVVPVHPLHMHGYAFKVLRERGREREREREGSRVT